ncbi:MAG: endonuclease III [Asgard group archaeon]|nr:endonuclease III [Asgard group archaeon]
MSNISNKKDQKILHLLEENYPEFKGGLINFSSPFQLLVAAILSAQSTDKQVNSITRELFSRFPSPQEFATASLEEIEKTIAKVGLYKNKAKFIKNMSIQLIDEHDSTIPTNIEDLTQLPGIGRKTANVLLNDWFEIHEGIAVDTHVKRISYRLGWTKNKNPIKIEQDMMEILPTEKWGRITHLLISHGRAVCKAQKPQCFNCFLSEYCPKVEVSKK